MAGLRWKEAAKGATEVLFKKEPRTLADGDPWPTCEQLHPLHHDPGGIQHTKKDFLNPISDVVLDAAPSFRRFGDVKIDLRTSYLRGATVNATLVGANLRNDLQLERTYAAVERLNGKNEGELPSEDE
ncbi:Neutral ceramidase B like protein [Verticillium longisporum]|nr:Neutral ceramidase B like protein [Verticillium longisporum]KAG7147059.1 Neutral ceramidase B like protein [Verticillium longisporum]